MVWFHLKLFKTQEHLLRSSTKITHCFCEKTLMLTSVVLSRCNITLVSFYFVLVEARQEEKWMVSSGKGRKSQHGVYPLCPAWIFIFRVCFPVRCVLVASSAKRYVAIFTINLTAESRSDVAASPPSEPHACIQMSCFFFQLCYQGIWKSVWFAQM